MKKIRLGAGSAYWGDLLEPAVELADKGELDYLCFDRLRQDIVAANAYVGGDYIARGLAQGADVVVCGRVSDTALFIGPMMHEFGWTYDAKDNDKIGAAITIGHTVECAALATGAVSN